MKIRWLVAFLLPLFSLPLCAQQDLDSLTRLAATYRTEDTVRANLLTDIAHGYFSSDPEKGLAYAEQAIALSEKLNDKKFLAVAHSVKGTNKMALGEYTEALDCYHKALEINQKIGNKQGVANNYNNIGLVYYLNFQYPKALEYYQKTLTLNEQSGNKAGIMQVLGNMGNIYNELEDQPKAIECFQRALTLCEQSGNLQTLSGILVNIGNVYTQMADYPKALEYKRKALEISEKLGDPARIANNLSNIGNVYTFMADYPRALQYHRKALALYEGIEDQKGMAASLAGISKACLAQRDYPNALACARKARDIALEIGALGTASEALEQLSDIFDAMQRYDSAYVAYHQFITLRDSINNVRVQKQITQKTLQFEFSRKEDSLRQQQRIQIQLKDNELHAQKTQRYFYLAGIALLALLSFFIFRNYRNQQHSNVLISQEKKKSDDLLRNILPSEVAEELKEKGEAVARHYEEVTVLFTDFVDFTHFAENRSPQQLVSALHDCFKAFDDIMERHGLEKIKTIGDAYMAVAGLPTPDARHARNAALAALDIQQYVRQQRDIQADGFEVRIGLHSGPVVAGIVGVKKFAYDIWGDTVNTAARMESSSEPGKINISGTTYALLASECHCTHRGKITAKNKGDIDMYYLEGFRSAASRDA